MENPRRKLKTTQQSWLMWPFQAPYASDGSATTPTEKKWRGSLTVYKPTVQEGNITITQQSDIHLSRLEKQFCKERARAHTHSVPHKSHGFVQVFIQIHVTCFGTEGVEAWSVSVRIPTSTLAPDTSRATGRMIPPVKCIYINRSSARCQQLSEKGELIAYLADEASCEKAI